MKAIWDFVKEIGWIGVIGIFLLVAGIAFGFDLSPKDLIDLSSSAWTPDKKFGVVCVATGILIVLAALVVGQARTLRKQMALDARQNVYDSVVRNARYHSALSYKDDPRMVSRVIRSAHEFEDEMKDILNDQKLDQLSREFVDTARELAKAFYLSVEHTEYVHRLDLVTQEVRMNDLPQDAYLDFSAKRIEWVKKTELLLQGAATMLGSPTS